MQDQRTGTVTFIDVDGLAPPPGYSNVVDVRGGRLVFIAGQAAFDESGNVVGVGDFDAQVAQVFENLDAALRAAACTPRDLIKLTVFLRDMSALSAYRTARDRFFGSVSPPAKPAITLVEVSRLFSDDLLIEIEGIAAARD